MSSQLSHLDTFVLSLERCLSFDAFIPTFYSRFLSSSARVQEKFANTDFDKQEKRLAQSLRILAGVMQGDQSSLAHLNARAESHDRHHLDIGPDLYILWRACLLETAEKFDPDWSPYVLESWCMIADTAIRYMTKRY